MAIQSVRGTRDILGEDYLKYQHLNQRAFEILPLYGYQGIETPLFESTALFQRGLGETSDIVSKEMYTFPDRNNELLTLRPEGTASVARAILQAGLTQTLPQKLFYTGPMFRYERPQKGRYRQFYSLGIECIGLAHPLADVECIALGDHLLKAWGITDYQLNINTLGDSESRALYRQALIDYFIPYKENLSKDSQIRLEKNPLRILDSKDPNDQILCSKAPIFSHYLNETSKTFFDQLQEGLTKLKIDFVLNPKLVRGIDYYCHTAFEFKTELLGSQDAILAGGRYDGLMQKLGGPALPAIGWGCGLDRIMLLLSSFQPQQNLKIGLIAVEEEFYSIALELSQNLRRNNIICEVPLNGNLSKKMKYVDKINCDLAILIGPEEYSQQQVKVRYLKKSIENAVDNSWNKETSVSLTKLLDYISSFKKD